MIQSKIAGLLEQLPAVALLGPRQVGKTTLALSLAGDLGHKAVYLDLELPSIHFFGGSSGFFSLETYASGLVF